MQAFATASGLTVVNDAYNANPTSMRAAVDTLAAMQADGRRVAVLGDMAELGSYTDLAHFRIGEHVAACGHRAARHGRPAREAHRARARAPPEWTPASVESYETVDAARDGPRRLSAPR